MKTGRGEPGVSSSKNILIVQTLSSLVNGVGVVLRGGGGGGGHCVEREGERENECAIHPMSIIASSPDFACMQHNSIIPRF